MLVGRYACGALCVWAPILVGSPGKCPLGHSLRGQSAQVTGIGVTYLT